MVLLVGASAGFVREYSGDFHYHLVMGEKTLTSGAIYRVDDLSHTFAGQTMLPSAWLGDVVLALGFRAGGYVGDYVLRAVCLLLMLLCLTREAKGQGLGPTATAVLLLVLMAQSCLVFYLRPEIFAYLAFAALYFVLGRPSRGPLWVLSWMTVLAAWANLHGSVVIGVMLMSCFAADRAWAALRERAWKTAAWAAAWVPLAVLATLANPNGHLALFAGRIMNPSYLSHTAEWAPLSWARMPPLVLVAFAAALSTVALGWRRISIYRLGAALVLVGLTLRHQRFVTFALVALVPLMARQLVELGQQERLRRLGQVAMAVTAATALWVLVGERKLFSELGLGLDRPSYPVAACDFVRDAQPKGQLLNNYDFGSYLLFCQKAPVFIDQRAWSLFPEWFYRRYLDAGQPSQLDALTAQYHLGWAFVKYDPLATALALDPPQWGLSYFDDQALIYVRRADNPSVRVFRYLDPFAFKRLDSLTGDALAAAREELERQHRRAPHAERTLLARAALAVAAGDDADYKLAEAELDARPLSAEALTVAATYADRHGDHARAAALRKAAGY